MKSHELWTEKYRPTKIEDYVFRDEKQKKQIKQLIDDGTLPHLLFTGVQGTGKTTLGKVLLNELEVDDFDIKFIKGSVDNSVETIRDEVTNFATTMGVGNFRYIFIDEADYLSPNAQAALRNTMEAYANGCRFILTANYPHRIIPAIHSRCQGFHVEKLDKTEFTARIATILLEEDIKFDISVLDMFVDASYPDLRKCINLCEMNSIDGELLAPSSDNRTESDYKLEAVSLFKLKKYTEARKLICSQIRLDEYDDFFRFMYDNLDFWSDGVAQKENEAIIVIRNGLVKHVSCADPEINLSATLIELEMIAQK